MDTEQRYPGPAASQAATDPAYALRATTGPGTSAAEAMRLAVLHEYRLLDAPAGDELTAVVRAAAVVAGVPNGTLNLIDETRQCQLTTVGFEGTDSAREDSMCALHFESGELVHVQDASTDGRYAGNPWVDGRLAAVRFYASAPLVSPTGHALGSLCVFDTVPGRLTAQQASVLEGLATVLVGLFERRRQARWAEEQARQAAEARELIALTMAQAEERWELSEVVAETIDVGLAVAGPDGRLSMLNRVARLWHGLDADVGMDPGEHARAYALLGADGVTPLAEHEVPLHRVLREGAVDGLEIVLAPPGRPRRTVVCSGRVMRRADGTTLGAVVAMTDVTDERCRQRALAQAHAALGDAHAALAEHSRRVEALAQASRALVVAEDPHAAICRAVVALTGAAAACLLRPDGDGLLHEGATVGLSSAPPLPPAVVGSVLAVPAYDCHGEPVASRRTLQQVGMGSSVWQPVLLPGGCVVGVLAVFWRTREKPPAHVVPMLQTLAAEAAHAIERTQLLRQLADAAERDPLTDLANRRRWDQALAAEIRRAERQGSLLTVAMLDLDHFKRFNDTHGHLEGDLLLREFAAAASACLRGLDTLARWGGEEFVVALPSCGPADARVVLDRIRSVVPRGQTCTVGVAEWFPGLQAADVTARADAALYRGKQAGRDVTVVHDETTTPTGTPDPGSAVVPKTRDASPRPHARPPATARRAQT